MFHQHGCHKQHQNQQQFASFGRCRRQQDQGRIHQHGCHKQQQDASFGTCRRQQDQGRGCFRMNSEQSSNHFASSTCYRRRESQTPVDHHQGFHGHRMQSHHHQRNFTHGPPGHAPPSYEGRNHSHRGFHAHHTHQNSHRCGSNERFQECPFKQRRHSFDDVLRNKHQCQRDC
ncbi:CLUMA_CG000219, isoform A [Clunio marinus]|uniref:CLUMA_CG000219, isoform A n=1 Tax=Clunio marinus TaxID=568069 RepID=A0A1J1HE23_9DIPT|nr:CLUMA_CG000219, isoform A [Clunio marinus]